MGYSTEFTLKIDLVGDEDNIIYAEFRKSNEPASYALSEYIGDIGEECKWYDHEKDLKEFSLLHPTALFTLEGNGEEDGDMWIKYFINGKVQTEQAHITYAPFDPAKLQ